MRQSNDFSTSRWQGRCRAEMSMRLCLIAILLPLIGACEQQTVQQRAPEDIRTVDNMPVRSVPVEQIEQLAEEATVLRPTAPSPAPKRPNGSPTPGASPQALPQMPFAPLIAMDPVDGSKVSIRVETPTTEYKTRIYYFASEENRRAFLADPERFVKSALSKY